MNSVRGCQLSCTYCAMGQLMAGLGRRERLALAARRTVARIRRKLGLIRAVPALGAPPFAPGRGAAGGAFQPGELVRVRPMVEIEAMLVGWKTQGLEFMPGMARYCGATLRVMKRVRYFFDEREWKMLRCSAVLLEGAICDGADIFDKEGCDRSCFFFWKDAWLERIPAGEATGGPRP